jgi:hypothetical protein
LVTAAVLKQTDVHINGRIFQLTGIKRVVVVMMQQIITVI